MDDRPAYSIGVVAQRTGVPADTIRAWERRYNVAVPRRTAGGHRLYSERDIETLLWLRDRVAQGMPISNAVALLGGLDVPPAAETLSRPRPSGSVATELEAALLQFRADRADAVLSEAFSLHGVERTCLEVMQTALRQIGDGWHAGAVSVAQEHYATNYITGRLHQLQMMHPVRGGPPVVLACAPLEQHQLGLAMLALLLTWRGLHVVNLGADVPAAALLSAVDEIVPKVVCLSASIAATAKSASEVARLIVARPDPPLLVYGGAVFSREPALRQGMPGAYLADDGAAAADAIVQLIHAPRTSRLSSTA